MKILNVVKCEFIKNYTLKKIIPTLMFLFLSVVVVAEFYRLPSYETDVSYVNKQEIESLYKNAKEEEKKNPSLANSYLTYYWKDFLEQREMAELLEQEESWKRDCYYLIRELNEKIFIINQMIENPNYSFEEIEENDNYVIVNYKEMVERIKEENKELKELKEDYIEELETYQKLFDEDEYYKYIQFLLENNKYTEGLLYKGLLYDSAGNLNYSEEVCKEAYEEIVSKKIKSSNDYRVKNIFLKVYLQVDDIILSKEELFKNFENMNYPNYEGYLRTKKALLKVYEKDKAILDYSIKNQKKQDIFFYGDINVSDSDNYITSKAMTNQVLYLGIIVLILVSMTSCGIVSYEHITKTDKILLTSPITRTKALLGKFIYLVLHTYIIWLVAFLMIFIYSGIQLGFHDLITPKFIYLNGGVHGVNYILYMIVQILISGIPLLAIVAILLFSSSATFSSTITLTVSLILSIYSVFIGTWVNTLYFTFGSGAWIKFMEYTPFLYANQQFMLKYGNEYLDVLGIINISPLKGIVVSIITIIISLFLACFIYNKRDIKN